MLGAKALARLTAARKDDGFAYSAPATPVTPNDEVPPDEGDEDSYLAEPPPEPPVTPVEQIPPDEGDEDSATVEGES